MERILQRWYDMISIRSVNGHEAQMADYVANVLRELGMDPHYSYFEEDTARERPSVWSVLDSGRPGKTVLLIGHIDTVGVSDRWKTDPFTPTEFDGKVYGRGAMDMKGGLAAILETLTYYAGSGWSQGGVEDMKEWVEEIAQAQAAAVSPLQVTVRK